MIIALHGVLNPVNMRFRLGLLYCLFGTHHLPDDRWPAELGIQEHPVPPGFAAQLVYPLCCS